MKRLLYMSIACLLFVACNNRTTKPNSESQIYVVDTYRDGYSYHIEDSCYTILEEQVTQEMWEEAYNHRFEYNYYRDTTDWWKNKNAEVAAFRMLSDSGKEMYVWGDLGLLNIGCFNTTEEYIVDIWWANEMKAVFVKNGVADSCIIAGSNYGTYGTNRIFVGCKGFDCDNCVWLYFYQTTDEPYHHTQFMCKYKNVSANFEATDVEEWYSKNPMVWYKDKLYYRAISWKTYQPVYYSLHLKNNRSRL